MTGSYWIAISLMQCLHDVRPLLSSHELAAVDSTRLARSIITLCASLSLRVRSWSVFMLAALLGSMHVAHAFADDRHDCSVLGTASTQQGRTFVVLNAVDGYADKFLPEFPGASRIVGLGTWGLWEKNESHSQAPRVEAIKKLAAGLGADKLIYLDIEHWQVARQSDANIREAVQKYLASLANVRDALGPRPCIGYYGVIPVVDFVRAIKPGTPAAAQWRHENDLMSALAREIDFVAPSLYTHSTDRDLWRAQAKAQIQEARRVAPGIPVLPFVWPRYHESMKGGLADTYLEPDFLVEQLEYVARCADGVIFWEYGRREKWDESRPWVKPFREFVTRVQNGDTGKAASCE